MSVVRDLLREPRRRNGFFRDCEDDAGNGAVVTPSCIAGGPVVE